MGPDILALAVSASAVLVGAIVTDGWTTAKSTVATLWRRHRGGQNVDTRQALGSTCGEATARASVAAVEFRALADLVPHSEVTGTLTTSVNRALPHTVQPRNGQEITDIFSVLRPFSRHSTSQLPGVTSRFVGRVVEIGLLSELLGDVGSSGGMVVVSAINGMAGIGKTTLALHWAHQVADRYPDGQLYVNLRGFDPCDSPMRPAEAVRGFLAALGVDPAGLPVGRDVQSALYRSVLTGRRVLIVLDNARDTDQVRPLLPGSPGCLVIVTSRNRLTGLVATEGARPVHLGLLGPAESHELLVRHLGEDRVAAEPAAVAEIIGRCAGLPLSLAIVAARAGDDPHLPLRDLAAELNDTYNYLNALDAGDSMADVRSVFSWSYKALSPSSARLFRLLGVHPGPDITIAAAASLSLTAPGAARRELGTLAQAHLVTQHVAGRYTFHDLLRAYASDQAGAIDTDTERAEALHRAVDHYLHTAHAAALMLDPHRPDVDLPQPPPGLAVETITDYDCALKWFTDERAVLLAVLNQARAEGLHTQVWKLAWCLTDFFDRNGDWHDQAAVQRMALTAADRLADPLGRAHSSRGLAHAYVRLGRYTDAEPLYQQAVDTFATLGDRAQQAGAHLNFAWMFELTKRYDKAQQQARTGLDLYRAAGHPIGEARALNAVGWYQTLDGDHHRALRNCQDALPLLRVLDVPHDEAYTLESIGHAHQHLGNHTEAAHCYQEALAIFNRLGDHLYAAKIHDRLGDLYKNSGDPTTAREHWNHALTILDTLHHNEAHHIRTALHNLNQPQPPT